ncbi:complement decay-accelerating factor isoform X14 [Neofelis nebulosa]|uniref:complement decay-accelerating factor isoform X14 n=1 Tax=Neofelis nebulosa TaxID=61452 RepID=UPI00272B3E67|nr:complement decay-accelerating factor isoform X14 [Neofelis nebulosa]
MGPARRSVPAALRFLGGLSVPLLLLLLCPPAAQGDCSLPPEVPNAHPTLSDRDLKSFPEGTTVTYKCNEGFVKVPGKPDSVICLSNNQWSEVAAFCNRSCDVPPRLRFASLKRSFSKQNYFPEGFVVEYDCRPGYRRNQTLSEKLTCLQNFTWSTPDEFCKKKSCPTPGDIAHGHVSITTDISYGASISFSCDTGYRLVGATSSYCSLVDQGVEWSDPLPKCEEIVCPEPQEISNGTIQNPRKTYVYQQSVKYQCNQGFTLIGENSIYCTVKDDQGEWSGLPPECKENAQISKGMPAVQKPSMASVPSTKVPSAPQKTTTVNVPAKQSSAVVPRATTHFRSTSSHKGRGTLSSDANIAAIALITYMKTEKHAVVFRNFTVIGDTSEVKPLVSSKRTHMYNIDSFAYDASNRRLADLAEEEIRRKYTQVCRIFLVS